MDQTEFLQNLVMSQQKMLEMQAVQLQSLLSPRTPLYSEATVLSETGTFMSTTEVEEEYLDGEDVDYVNISPMFLIESVAQELEVELDGPTSDAAA